MQSRSIRNKGKITTNSISSMTFFNLMSDKKTGLKEVNTGGWVNVSSYKRRKPNR